MVRILATVFLLAALVFWAACLGAHRRNGTWDGPADGFGALACLTNMTGFALLHWWPIAALCALTAILFIRDWWRNRRRRGRARAWIGAKSRALRDALVRKQRQAWKPRPVLRPVPGGAR